jgi:hypothetical protein
MEDVRDGSTLSRRLQKLQNPMNPMAILWGSVVGQISKQLRLHNLRLLTLA